MLSPAVLSALKKTRKRLAQRLEDLEFTRLRVELGFMNTNFENALT